MSKFPKVVIIGVLGAGVAISGVIPPLAALGLVVVGSGIVLTKKEQQDLETDSSIVIALMSKDDE